MAYLGSFDVVVVGGGLVGSAIAFGLVKKNLKVAVLDEGDVAFRASRGNFGLIWIQSKGAAMPPYARWSQLSARLWDSLEKELLEETGIDLHYQRTGGFHFCFSESEMIARERMMQRLAQAEGSTFKFEMLDAATLRRRFPRIGPVVVGASFSPHDGHVNPLRLLRALRCAFLARGGRYFPAHRVEGVTARDGSFTVKAVPGSFGASRIVLAAGLGNGRLAPSVGLKAPLRPVRGQILVTAKVPTLLDVPTSLMRQTGEGGLILGDSMEEVGLDDRTTPTVMKMLAKTAVTTFPELASVKIIRSWAALRILTHDGYPIYSQSRDFPGAFLASLHSGVTLAAVHVGKLGPAIAEGGLPSGVEAFSDRRVNVPQAA